MVQSIIFSIYWNCNLVATHHFQTPIYIHIHFLIFNDSTIQIAGDTYSRPIPHHMKVKTQQTMVTRFHMTKAGSEQNASEGNQCSALRRWIFGLIRWRTFASWKFAMGMDLVQGKSTGTRHRLDLVSTSHTFVLIFPKTHWNENCLTSGSGYSSNEPGAPSTLRPRQWKWQPVLQGLRPSKAWKGNLSPKKTFFPLQISSKNLRSRFVLPLPMGTISRNVIRRWFVWFVCSVWARVTWFTHTHAYPRIGHHTQTALFQEWPIFVWRRTASKFWKDLD